ncbi:hypothetical protein AB1L88_26970, partial [Tautonia sp. JC769]|uniref:hypothetical protein n=1 Tax=Tautonia sp. JC769 TaxID=3232135 RepID=UPI003457F0FD
LVGLWALSLHGQVQLSYDAIPAAAVSVAGLLRVYRSAMRDYGRPLAAARSLDARLSRAVIAPSARSHKASRDYPRKKRERVPGAPELRPATEREIEQGERLLNAHFKRLTA